LQQELLFRRQSGYPPFSRLIRVLAEGQTEGEAKELLRAAAGKGQGLAEMDLLGPAPAVLLKVKDRWRWHMLCKCYTPAAFARTMAALGTVEDLSTRTCRITLDVDPGSLL